MRFHRPLDDVLGNGVCLALLRVLTRSAPRGLTGRALARSVGYSPTQTGRALGTLEGVGIVRREMAGRAFLWRMATDHLLARPLTQLFDTEERSLQSLKSDLSVAIAKLPAKRAWLFGSIAKGEERATSDIDLLVEVGSPQSKQLVEDALSELTTRFIIRFGNPLSPLVFESGRGKGSVDHSLARDAENEGILIEASR